MNSCDITPIAETYDFSSRWKICQMLAWKYFKFNSFPYVVIKTKRGGDRKSKDDKKETRGVLMQAYDDESLMERW